MQKYLILFLVLFPILLVPSAPQKIITADFLYQATKTSGILWNNFVGPVFYFDEIEKFISSSTFKGYLKNSNIYGNFPNNWATCIRMPKGFHYECSVVSQTTPPVQCKREMKDDNEFFVNLGTLVWDTTFQPFWTFGLNNEFLDWSSFTVRSSLSGYINKIYEATRQIPYHIEVMYEGDKAVQNGLRSQYSVQDFLNEAGLWESAAFGVKYRAPGVSQDASKQWMHSMLQYFSKVLIGAFTVEAIIFTDPDLVTYENLLSDKYTKQFIRKRLTTEDLGEQSLFNPILNVDISFSNIRLLEGNGKDLYTNSMAAAIWAIDFTLECALLGFYDIHFDARVSLDNKQGVLSPSLEPQAMYYAMIFCSLMMNNSPQIILPEIQSSLSEKIKVWGLKTTDKLNIIIINKDTDPNLNGTVQVVAKSQQNSKMVCIYLEAPSLSSTAKDMKIGGHQYQTGNSTIIGNYQEVVLLYNPQTLSYQVPLKYAQVAHCSMENFDLIIPIKESCFEKSIIISWQLFVFLLLPLLGFK